MNKNIQNFYISPQALDRYNPGIKAADATGINIFGEIGWDVTDAGVAKALEGQGDVVVNINSIGGSMFQGIAIYNMLRDHPGNVKVRVLGQAASAASVIAMAGDEVEIASSAFLMIHNAWVMAAGNRMQLREVADYLEPFDVELAKIYAERTGLDAKEIAKLMDAETWINGNDAVEYGYADALLPSDRVEEEPASDKKAAAKLDLLLARVGLPRSERKKLMKEFKSGGDTGPNMPGAVPSDMLDAVAEMKQVADDLKNIFRSRNPA